MAKMLVGILIKNLPCVSLYIEKEELWGKIFLCVAPHKSGKCGWLVFY